ncbi:oxidoreductase, short chain dehydrogenase/reductase family protein [Plesiocystis pacifica SIR-1]|uniref:Oxidoreductase, short chain dehydrogenase/reductase family protein n=1 Tax=Plesiocystis pacifica SIR-1 TaxID=391625 RepID=A6GAH4_9BACT|nr:SDR family NAD(P)-dependent oxidoreductase [Plesiocystis pacifica]EDM77162.1 oxidoreductase, short chain dehydrogenase/reductase family protein [Plesiocystis pacifica SIR-1]
MAFRSALITGASSGIGAAIAHTLAAEGSSVVLAARREDKLAEVAESIAKAHGADKVRVQVLDVSDPERTEATVRELDGELAFDLVIANAGVSKSTPGPKLSWKAVETVVSVNVCGAVATLTGALPGMVERGAGHLVGVSSVAKYRGLPSSAAYCASKAFLSTFLESLRVDLHHAGIRVTDIRPGFVETEMTAGIPNKPFEVTAADAAQRVVRAIHRGRGVFIFPVPMTVFGPIMGAMPSALLEPMMRQTKK